jgi:serine protease Do
VKLGRLEDAEKARPASVQSDAKPDDKTVVQKALGLDLANISVDLRKRFKIKDSVKGVVITGIDQNSAAAEKRLNAGDTIVEVAQEAVGTTDDFQKKVEKLKKDGRKLALLLVANPEGELRFVTLSLQ